MRINLMDSLNSVFLQKCRLIKTAQEPQIYINIHFTCRRNRLVGGKYWACTPSSTSSSSSLTSTSTPPQSTRIPNQTKANPNQVLLLQITCLTASIITITCHSHTKHTYESQRESIPKTTLYILL